MAKIKIYTTKYLFTKGIEEREIHIEEVRDKCVMSLSTTYTNDHFYYRKGQYFFKRDEAVKEAERMVICKIKSLEDKLKKLKELKF